MQVIITIKQETPQESLTIKQESMSKQEMMEKKCLEVLEDAVEEAKKKIKTSLNCGALDVDGAKEDSYTLPKIIISAVLQSVGESYKPFLKKEVEDYKNLLNFV